MSRILCILCTLTFAIAAVFVGVVSAGPGTVDGLVRYPANADYDGDGETDYTITRSSGGYKIWYYFASASSTGHGFQWGFDGDREIAADFDGDGTTDIAVWRDSHAGGDPNKAHFYAFRSSDSTVYISQFGKDGDDPSVVGDYDGDGRADAAVFRENGSAADPCGAGHSVFYYRPSGSEPLENWVAVCWGQPGDVPTAGDFDGDGKYDFCVRRNVNGSGAFFIKRSSDEVEEVAFWGLATDAIVPGDYDGDGRNDFAVARQSDNSVEFYIRMRAGGGTGAQPIVFGSVDPNIDHLAPGDYDGDGTQDLAVWYASAIAGGSYFVVRLSANGAIRYFPWGRPGDNVPAEWVVTGGQ